MNLQAQTKERVGQSEKGSNRESFGRARMALIWVGGRKASAFHHCVRDGPSGSVRQGVILATVGSQPGFLLPGVSF